MVKEATHLQWTKYRRSSYKLKKEIRKIKCTYICQECALACAYLSILLCCNVIVIVIEMLYCYCYYTCHEVCQLIVKSNPFREICFQT